MLLILEIIGALALAAVVVFGVRWLVKSVKVKEHNAYIGEQVSSAPDPQPKAMTASEVQNARTAPKNVTKTKQ